MWSLNFTYVQGSEVDLKEIVTGAVPYRKLNDFGVMYAIVEGRLPERPEDSMPTKSRQGDFLWSLLIRCWDCIVESRPSASDVRDSVSKHLVYTEALSNQVVR